MDAKRGFVPEDVRNFSPEAVRLMRTASRHVCFLINEGYDLKQASTFVGNHYLLSERQRTNRLPPEKENRSGSGILPEKRSGSTVSIRSSPWR